MIRLVPRSYLWRKLRRWLGVTLLLAVVACGGLAVVRHVFDQRLATVLRRLDERDPGWRIEELERVRAPVPDADNAARVVAAVVNRLPERFMQRFFAGTMLPLQGDPLGRTSAVKAIPPLPGRERLSPEHEHMLRLALQRTGSAAEEARTLANYTRGRFAIEHYGARSAPSPDGIGIRQLTFLLRHDALLQIHEGKIHEALTNCRAVLAAGRAIGDEPAPAYQVMRLECWDEALNILNRALAQGQATDEDLCAVQRLLELEAAEPLEQRLLRGEVALCHLRFSALEAGELKLFASRFSPPVAGVLDWLATDAVKLSHAGALDFLSRRAAAARLPEPEQTAALRRLDQENHSQAPLGTWLGEWRSRRLVAFVRPGRIRLQAATAALAAERYRLRHGHWPDRMAALVPEQLAQLPDDPYTHRPLVFRKLRDSLVIYSVGRDGLDNQGRINLPPESPGADVGFRLWDERGR